LALNKINKLERSFLADELSIFNSVYNLVVAVDYQGRVIIFNPTSERVFNYPAEKALGRHIREVIPFTGLPKVLQTGKPHIGRKFVVGNALYVVNRTPIIRNNTIVGAIGVAQEITELQHLAQELKEVKEINDLLESIFHSTREGYLAITNEGRILMLNQPMAELLGVSIDSAVGRHIRDIVHDKRLPQILWTGRFQYGELVRIQGRETVVMRMPLYNQGRLVGAVSKVIFQDVEQLLALAENISSQRRTFPCHTTTFGDSHSARYTVDSLIGNSKVITRLRETVSRVAQGPSTVLIRGESGTGKELVAHALHANSPRHKGPFIKVNCAAVPENLLESELFGYQEGAFTGARKGGQVGKFELANGGTIFLDEIGDMPLPMQAKILRVLQEKEIERLGDSRPRPVDVRVVAATNRDLEELIRQGRFREDLYYRLNVVSIYIPPLRERIDDIPLLVNHFIQKFNCEFGVIVQDVSPEVLEVFCNYHWPGNVRELENVLERAFNLVDGNTIELKHLPPYLQQASQGKKRNLFNHTLATLLREVEKEALLEALAAAGGNKMQAARNLGISRAWLYKKMKQYGIK
jgi:PAS domain S-box-containing protein